jgi:uncharacterized protein YuzE
MTITVGDTTFDRVDYDGADVLYLHTGDPAAAATSDESPEGHGLRFDADGRLIGITIVGARRALETDHRLVVTRTLTGGVGRLSTCRRHRRCMTLRAEVDLGSYDRLFLPKISYLRKASAT